jgi:hypothetical protein
MIKNFGSTTEKITCQRMSVQLELRVIITININHEYHDLCSYCADDRRDIHRCDKFCRDFMSTSTNESIRIDVPEEDVEYFNSIKEDNYTLIEYLQSFLPNNEINRTQTDTHCMYLMRKKTYTLDTSNDVIYYEIDSTETYY